MLHLVRKHRRRLLVYSDNKSPNELVVVAVTHVKKQSEDALTGEQLTELTKLYQQLRGQQEFDDYTRYLKDHAKIK